jgi:DNA-binding transcriptional LysR family regulator
MTVELRQLRHFVAVAEQRSFTAAAARLHVVQSAVSVSIRGLEREVGMPLFHRTTHEVSITDAGLAMLTEARRTLAAADAALDAVEAVRGGVRGSLRLGIMQSVGLIDLASILTRYHRERPRVEISLRSAAGGSAALAAEVAEGRLDLAFAGMPPAMYPAGLSLTPLAAEPLLLACAPDHRLAARRTVPLRELVGEQFVDFPPGWGTRLSVDQRLSEASVRREVLIEVADISTVADLVRANFGVAFLARSTIANTRGIVLRPVDPSPLFAVSLVASDGLPRSAAATAFIEIALRVVAETERRHSQSAKRGRRA